MARASMVENINKNVQVHMNAMHSRKQGKTTVKRAFSLVLNGVLISSMLFGSITLAGCQNANEKTITTVPTAVTQQVNVDDETTYITNLNLAIKAIKDTITSNNWSATSFDSLCKSLLGIETKLNLDGFKSSSSLIDAIKEADKTVKGVDIFKLSNIESLKEKHTNAVESLGRIKNKLGIQDEQNNQSANSSVDEEVAVTTDDAPSSTNTQSSTSQSEATVPKGNITISKPSNVSVANSSSQQAQTSTEKSNSSSSTSVQTSAPAASTVPDKYKGYNKTSAKLATVNSDETIFTKYGNHTYGSKNQSEYDKVLSKVEAAVKNTSLSNQAKTLLELTRSGKKYTDYSETDPNQTNMYYALKVFQKTWGYMIMKVDKVNPKDTEKYLLENTIWSKLAENSQDTGDASPNSAYNVLFENRGDCDAYAQLELCIADVLGLNSKIVASTTHGDAYIQVAGSWWHLGTPVNPNTGTTLVGPTYK